MPGSDPVTRYEQNICFFSVNDTFFHSCFKSTLILFHSCLVHASSNNLSPFNRISVYLSLCAVPRRAPGNLFHCPNYSVYWRQTWWSTCHKNEHRVGIIQKINSRGMKTTQWSVRTTGPQTVGVWWESISACRAGRNENVIENVITPASHRRCGLCMHMSRTCLSEKES